MSAVRVDLGTLLMRFFVLAVLLLFDVPHVHADVIINVLAVNGKDVPQDKDIQFSLPGEIKPGDIIDPAGLTIDYNVKDAGYFLHGRVLLQAKESRTLKVKIKDVWRLKDEDVALIKATIDQGFKELGSERSAENGVLLKDKLMASLDYILDEEAHATGSIDQRIDTYRSHLQTLEDLKAKASLIDYWRSDAADDENPKIINYMIEVRNPLDKVKKVKQQHFLPREVRPEYVVDRQGYEIRFDEKKNQAFLFKEEDLAAGEKKEIRIGIKDVWLIKTKDMDFIRERSTKIHDLLVTSSFMNTANALFRDVINNLDLVQSLQEMGQPDIQQHIGAFRVNEKRFEKAKDDLVALEKLLARHQSELEKSRIKNVMQKMQNLKSLSRVSQAMFDKKPTVNAAWKMISYIMMFLAFFTLASFIIWFVRTSKEKKREQVEILKAEKKDV
jgi:hypothetical protein